MDAIIENYQNGIELSAKKTFDYFNNVSCQQQQQPLVKPVCAKEKINESKKHAIGLSAGDFRFENHFYPKVLSSKINKTGKSFFNMKNEHIIERYCARNSSVIRAVLAECLAYRPKHFKWAGCDLFNVTDGEGKRQMIIIETNSCPSGIKSMPRVDENNEYGSYKRLIGSLYDTQLAQIDRSLGDLAVVYDKNLMEASGYCALLAELANEKVWLVEYLVDNEEDKENCSKNVKWMNGFMYVRDRIDQWHKIRACLRYVTQKPWTKLPVNTKTLVLNPLVACLAGGRNKALASYAYQRFNDELAAKSSNLTIRQPYSLINVNKCDIPRIIETDPNLRGKAVIKVPYSNCGQGVYTIINKKELDDFMRIDHCYDKFILQSLVGNANWSTDVVSKAGEYFHIGTKPNESNEIFVYDLRLTVTTNKEGFLPVSVNFRKARKPLVDDVDAIESSWDVLGTNLSVKLDKNAWDTETDRLMVLDDECFEQLRLDENDLIDSYVQTVLSMIAIDKMCIELIHDDDRGFNFERFKRMNPDYSLLNEIRF